jgi:hypothetical protein
MRPRILNLQDIAAMPDVMDPLKALAEVVTLPPDAEVPPCSRPSNPGNWAGPGWT